MLEIGHKRKEEILMRSAQSRLGLVSSLASARQGVGRCAQAVPVSARAVKMGVAVVGGLAGAALVRSLFRRSRKPLPPPAPVVALPAPRMGVGRLLATESVVLLLLPLCRHYLLGENTPVSDRLVPMINRLFKKKAR